MDISMTQELDLTGSGGGKGGGGQTFREDENTLQSNTTVRIVEVLSEGQVRGLVAGAKSIFLDDTPVQNADGSFNFGGKVAWDFRAGLPSQAPMPGFPGASSVTLIGVEVTNAASQTRTVSSPSITASRVTIGFRNGLYLQDTSNNALVGASVSLRIEKKLTSSGAWLLDREFTVSGKTTSPYEETYRVERPSGTGTWDIRITRLTIDGASSTLRDNTFFERLVEIQDVQLEYDDTAYVGLAVDAKAVGANRIPVRSYEMYGIICRIPSNFNPIARTFTGVWDGTFKMGWTDDPSWILYDIITHERYGLGERIGDSQVDKFSFYDASVYNNQLVPNGAGGTEPRFTCNVVIARRDDALRLLQSVAGVMRSKIMWMGGLVTVVQDRPGAVVKLVNKTNVIDGRFEYKSSTLQERYTAVNVTWNDPADKYLQRITTIEAGSAEIERYGYNSTDIAAFGCTTEGQAIRHGKWFLDSVLNQTEIVNYKSSFEMFDLIVGEVISLFDEDYAGSTNSGRLLSGSTSSSLVLDRPVTVTPGSTIQVRWGNGAIETGNIVQTSGTHSTVTVSPALTGAIGKGAPYIVTTTVAPRKFRISRVTQSEPNILDVEALLYDPNKYARIETGVSIPSPIFSSVGETLPGVPTDLTFLENVLNIDNRMRRSLLVGWTAPTNGVVSYYRLQWRINGAAWTTVEARSNFHEIRDLDGGTVEVKVFAVTFNGQQSVALAGTYGISLTAGTGSPLNPVTNLQIFGGTGTDFTGTALFVEFTNPTTNSIGVVGLRDFEVKVLDPVTSAVMRTEYLPPVAAGAKQQYGYSYSKNLADGGPRRAVRIEVRCRDANNKLSNVAAATFSNSVPAYLSGITVSNGIGSVKVQYTLPTESDFDGVLIWRSTTSGFTPAEANLVYDTLSSFMSDSSLTSGTTYYYKLAAYDTFSKPLDGVGLNISAQYTGTPMSNAGIPQGPTLPGTGTQGDLFFNTTDNKLYRYTGSAWTAAVPTVDLVGTVTSAQIGAGTIQTINIADAAIAANNLADASVTSAAIAAAGVQAVNLAAESVTSPALGAGSVLAEKIGEGQVPYSKLTISDVNNYAVNGTFRNLKSTAYGSAPWATWLPLTDWEGVGGARVLGTSVSVSAVPPYAMFWVGPGVSGAGSYPSSPIGQWNNVTFDTTGNEVLLLTYKVASGQFGYLEGDIEVVSGAGAYTVTRQFSVTGPDGPWSTGSTVTPGGVMDSNPFWHRLTFTPTTTNDKRVRLVMKYWGASVGFYGPSDLNGDGFSEWQYLQHTVLRKMNAAQLIVDGSIVTNHLAASSITADKIVSEAISADKIAANAITTVKLAADSVTAAKIVAGTITASKIAASTITGDRLVAGTITSNEIASNSITTAKLAAGAVTANEIAANTITAAKIAANTITAAEIAANTISTGQLAANSITSNELAANSVTAGKILAASVSTNELASNAITADKIDANAVTAAKIAANTITADKIAAGTITATEIATNAITASKISASTITTDKLVVGSVSTSSQSANVFSNYIIPAVSGSQVYCPDALSLTLTHVGRRVTYAGNFIFSANVIDSSATTVVVNMILNWGGSTYNGGSYVFPRYVSGGPGFYQIRGSIPLFISFDMGGSPGTITVKAQAEFFFTEGNIAVGDSGPHGDGTAKITYGGYASLQEMRV